MAGGEILNPRVREQLVNVGVAEPSEQEVRLEQLSFVVASRAGQ
jgi:hypothetical protein